MIDTIYATWKNIPLGKILHKRDFRDQHLSSRFCQLPLPPKACTAVCLQLAKADVACSARPSVNPPKLAKSARTKRHEPARRDAERRSSSGGGEDPAPRAAARRAACRGPSWEKARDGTPALEPPKLTPRSRIPEHQTTNDPRRRARPPATEACASGAASALASCGHAAVCTLSCYGPQH